MVSNFGYEEILEGVNGIESYLRGTMAKCPDDGIGQSITVCLTVTTLQHKVKCALYDASGNLVDNGVTEERTIPIESNTWETFNFGATKPILLANTDYIIVAWSEPVTGNCKLAYGVLVGWTQKYTGATYNDFPTPVSFATQADYGCSIYCSYSTGAPPPPVGTLTQVI